MKKITDQMLKDGYHGYMDEGVCMFSFLKEFKCGYIAMWEPGEKAGAKNRIWKIDVTKDGKVIIHVEGTNLDGLQNEITHHLKMNLK